MPKFIVERILLGAGVLTQAEIEAMMATHCDVVKTVGPQIQWLESYMTDDKVFCVYIAPDEATIRLHAKLGGFPIDSVLEVRQILQPQTIFAWNRDAARPISAAEA